MTFKLWQFRMWFFLNEMEKNLRYEPYFSLKFWEKIFLILKTKLDWIVIIIQNLKKQEENIIVVRAFFEHTVWKRFWPHQPLCHNSERQVEQEFSSFSTLQNIIKIWQKMKKILVQLFFNSLLLHKGTKKNPNSGYISTIFFHYYVMCDFTKKVRWQRRITTVNDKIDAFLFHYFYFQKIDRKKKQSSNITSFVNNSVVLF